VQCGLLEKIDSLVINSTIDQQLAQVQKTSGIKNKTVFWPFFIDVVKHQPPCQSKSIAHFKLVIGGCKE
jgi:hypothetical protein